MTEKVVSIAPKIADKHNQRSMDKVHQLLAFVQELANDDKELGRKFLFLAAVDLTTDNRTFYLREAFLAWSAIYPEDNR